MSRSFGRAAAALARVATWPLNPWREAMARAYAAQLLTPTWVAHTSAGDLTFHGPSGRALHDAYTFGREEPETVAWIESLPPDAVLWDIGANVGIYAIFAAKRGVRVLAFEPSAATLAVLTRNIETNGVSDRIAAYGVALSDKTGLDRLYMAAERTEPGHAIHSFGTRETIQGRTEGGFEQAAIGFTADEFVRYFSAPAPTHIKLDVDSIEAQILHGAKEIARAGLREIMVEIYDEKLSGQAREIRAALDALDFAEIPTAYPNGRNRLFARRQGG